MHHQRSQQSSQALPFITYSESSGYKLQPEAVNFLTSLPESNSYAVMTIVGKTKTGKSFLLNQLLNNNQMFPMNSYINKCSRGIQISTQLIKTNGLNVIVLDTEGIGSIEGNDDQDCKIFILALLMSSVLVYNSMGTIDEQTLNNLSMIIEVVKVFEKEIENHNSLPGLFWVLRDFTLKMEDRNGIEISPKEYLESSLEQQKGSSQTIYHKNRIRRIIKTLFTERTCETLVIPSQNVIIKEGQQPALREQFTQDLKRTQNKLRMILNKKGQKKFCNLKMTPQTFLNAARVYIESFNRANEEGIMPKIENLTFQLRENQAKNCRRKFKQNLETWKDSFVEQICELRLNNELVYAKSEELKIMQKINEFYEASRGSLLQLTGKLDDQELYDIKSWFTDSLYRICEERIAQKEKQRQSSLPSQQQIQNICQFFTHVQNDEDLQKQYLSEIEEIKEKNIKQSPVQFSNVLMKIELAYLRRKVELGRQTNLAKQKLFIELDYAKKQIMRLQQKNKELEEQVFKKTKELTFTASKQNQTYLTPMKEESKKEISKFSQSKKKNTKTEEWNGSERKPLNALQFSIKNETSTFFVPYVVLDDHQHLIAKIVRTLIKEDSKRNQYIEYVIEVNVLGQRWIVNRKWKDFCELTNILMMMFENRNLPECEGIRNPKPLDSSIHSNSRKEVVEERRKELEEYMGKLLEVESVRNSRIMQKFLKINKQYSMI